METTRRSFLHGLFAGVAATTAAVVVPQILLPDPEPVRRYWFFGERFLKKRTWTGLVPVLGEPGMFVDMSTGQVLNLRDFKESDKYDTIQVPEERMTFFADERHRIPAPKYPLIKNRGDCPPSDLTFDVPRADEWPRNGARLINIRDF